MRLYPVVFSFALLISLPFQAPTAQAQKKVQDEKPEEDNPQAQVLINEYRFEEAESLLQKEITTAQRKKRPTQKLDKQLQQAQMGTNMLMGTEKIIFIDSIKVPTKQILSHFHLSEGCGKVENPGRLLKELASVRTGASGYLNELGDRILYAIPDKSGHQRLYSSDKLGSRWNRPRPLAGLEGDSLQDYPFLMPDGVTLYFAAQNDKSLGGYDIFVTRYNTDTHQYLQPENIGMPFNSPANDYLYVIDEQAQIGWFVTDRNQPADTACIYMFIPNSSRQIYEWSDENEEAIRQAARITSIRKSQEQQGAKVAAAMERLKGIGQETEDGSATAFRFVVNDHIVYTSMQQFKNPQSREKAEVWLKKHDELQSAAQKLDELRIQYHTEKNDALRNEILRLEPLVQQLSGEVKKLAKEIRKAELQ